MISHEVLTSMGNSRRRSGLAYGPPCRARPYKRGNLDMAKSIITDSDRSKDRHEASGLYDLRIGRRMRDRMPPVRL